MEKNIIGVCSVGSGVGQSVVDSCQTFREKVKLVGLGNNPLAYGAFDCDDYAIIPSYYDSHYIDMLKERVEYYKIDILIPGHDDEAMLLAKHIDAFSINGTTILVSPYDLIYKCRNKATYIDSFYELAGYFVKTYKPNEIKDKHFPLIAKPEQGFASKDIFIITNHSELNSIKENKNYIFQEIATPKTTEESYTRFMEQLKNGKNLQVSEISLQLIFDKNSNLADYCATYNSLQNGVPVEIQPYSSVILKNFIDQASLTFKRLKAFGPVNIQGRMTDSGFKVFEINPRFTGITGLRAKLGFNEVEYCIFKLILEQCCKPLILAENYIGLRQVANKKVPKSRLKILPKEKKQNLIKVLITGSTGMIGSHLAQLLDSQGHDVSTLTTKRSLIANNGNSYTYEDLRCGKVNLSEFDRIVHLGFSRPNSSENEIQESILNSLELITQATQSAVDQFIFVSSQSVYGFSSEKTHDEESPTNPQSNYARAKLTVEGFIKNISKLTNETKFLILRLASTMAPYGENLNHEAYSLMLSKLCKKENINIYSPHRLISKIDLFDAIDALAFFTIQEIKKPCEIVNIAPAKNEALLNIMLEAAKELEAQDNILVTDKKDSQSKNLSISPKKAHIEYGWKSKRNIQDTAIFFREYLGKII